MKGAQKAILLHAAGVKVDYNELRILLPQEGRSMQVSTWTPAVCQVLVPFLSVLRGLGPLLYVHTLRVQVSVRKLEHDRP